MHTLNILSKHKINFYERVLKEFEERYNFEFVLVDGFSTMISPEVLKLNIKLKKGNKPFFILLNSKLNGGITNKIESNRLPKFSRRYEDFLKNLSYGSVRTTWDYKSHKGFESINSISGKSFAHISTNSSNFENPTLFLKYDLEGTNDKVYAGKILKYIIDNSFKYHIDGYTPEEWMSKEYPDDIEDQVSTVKHRLTKSTQKNLTEVQSNIKSLEPRLMEYYRQQRNFTNVLASENKNDIIIGEMEAINKTDDICWCDFTSDGRWFRFLVKDVLINVDDPSYPEYKGVYDLGNILVCVDFTNLKVNINNIDGNYIDGNKSHPHDMGGGELCLGEMKSVLPELISEFKLVDIVDIMVSFLKSANMEDIAGRRIRYYKKIK